MKKIKIEKGVPICRRKGSRKYPFDKMVVGDSFKIPYDRLSHMSIYSAIQSFKKYTDKGQKWKFMIRSSKSENWIRVWRVQ